LGSIIDACQHNDGTYRRNPKGCRKEERHCSHRPDPRQNANKGSDKDPGETIKEVYGLKGYLESEENVVDHFCFTRSTAPSPPLKAEKEAPFDRLTALSVVEGRLRVNLEPFDRFKALSLSRG